MAINKEINKAEMVVNAIAQCVHLARHFNKANSVTVFLAIELFYFSEYAVSINDS